MMTRKQRRQTILELVSRNQITSQDQLQALLLVEGVRATQATISRDMRDLGIIKRPAGYAVVDFDDVSRAEMQELRRLIKADVQNMERAGSLLVVKTRFGVAKALAAKIEQTQLPHIVGTMASDDTIFIATRTPGQAGELKRLIQKLVR